MNARPNQELFYLGLSIVCLAIWVFSDNVEMLIVGCTAVLMSELVTKK